MFRHHRALSYSTLRRVTSETSMVGSVYHQVFICFELELRLFSVHKCCEKLPEKYGIDCHQSVVDKYNEFKKKDSGIGYMVCKIEEKFIQIEVCHERQEGDDAVDDKGVPKDYKELETLCIKEQCRYAFYIFKWESPGGPREMVVLIQYCDDNASSKVKLPYSTTTSVLKKCCNGVGLVIEANDKDEISYNEILDKCKKMKTR